MRHQGGRETGNPLAGTAAPALLAAGTATAQDLTEDRIRAATGAVDAAAIFAYAAETRNWPSHGLDCAESRVNRVDGISTANMRDRGMPSF